MLGLATSGSDSVPPFMKTISLLLISFGFALVFLGMASFEFPTLLKPGEFGWIMSGGVLMVVLGFTAMHSMQQQKQP